MSKVISGRKPVSTKVATSFSDDLFGNRLAIADDLKKELKEQGLEGRWVNYKKLVDNQGHHEKGWIAYKRKKSDIVESSTFLNGTDPDGYIRRGDAILAVKRAEDAERHRAFLRDKAQRQLGYNKEKADELRKMAREAGLNSRIDDQYDSDGDDE